MDPIIINFPPIASNTIYAGGATVIPANTPFPLSGGAITNTFTGATSYFYEFASGLLIQPWLVNSSGTNYTTTTFTFSGTGLYGQAVNASAPGPAPNSAAVFPIEIHKITSVTANTNVSNVSIGTSGFGFIEVTTDYWNKEAQYTLQYTNVEPNGLSGPSIKPYYSSTKPYSFENGQYTYNSDFDNDQFEIPLGNPNIMISPAEDITDPLNANTIISMQGTAVTAFSTRIYSELLPTIANIGTGNVTFTFLQQGAQF